MHILEHAAAKLMLLCCHGIDNGLNPGMCLLSTSQQEPRGWFPSQCLSIKKIWRWWMKETKRQEKNKTELQENAKAVRETMKTISNEDELLMSRSNVLLLFYSEKQ